MDNDIAHMRTSHHLSYTDNAHSHGDVLTQCTQPEADNKTSM